LDKRLVFAKNLEKERDVFFVREDGRYLQKRASGYHPLIAEYIANAVPLQNLVQVLITALGAYEFWGQNVNGDRFLVPALSHEGADYGYQTFKSVGNYFTHHVNKDPALAKGQILHSVWNDKSKRVELIIGIDPRLDPEGAASVDRGDDLAFSMGCFISGTPIRMANGTTKDIEFIQIGDLVLNARGLPDKVTELHPRPYTANLICVKALSEKPIYVTPQHPFLAIQPNRSNGPLRTEALEKMTPDWVPAATLKVGDLLAIPIIPTVETPEWATGSLMKLFGIYLAEGHVVRNKQKEIAGISLATHRDDPIHSYIDRVCQELGAVNPPVTRHNSPERSEFSRTISIYDSRLGELCYRYCGSYADKKYLSAEIMNLDPELQLTLLGAFIDGDGWQCKDTSHLDVVMLSTCNEVLAYQFQQILARNGMLSTINKIKHSAGAGFNHHETFEFQLYCSVTAANILSKYSKKVHPTSRNSQVCGQRRIVNGYILTPIKTISHQLGSGTVYNFEVETDHSYVVDKIAVHNCKVPFDVCTICYRKAKTKEQYCDHLKYLMNQMDPLSGKLIGADNTFPRFFDLSRVLIPADKTAHMWQKVASAANPYRSLGSAELAALPPGKIADMAYLHTKVASLQDEYRKKASITKRIDMPGKPIGTLDNDIPISKALLQETSPSLPPEVLEKLHKAKVALADVLLTFAMLGCEPKRDELAELHPGALPTSLPPGKFDPSVASALLPMLAERSFARPHLMRRIVTLSNNLDHPEIVKKAQSIRDLIEPIHKHEDTEIHPGYWAGLFAALYALFGPSVKDAAKSLGSLLTQHPYIALPLGAGLIQAYRTLSPAPTKSGVYDVDANLDGLYNKNWQSRFAAMQTRPVAVIKTGAAQADTELAKKVFYGVPAIYLGAHLSRAHADATGKKQSPVSHYISHNPDIASYGLIAEHLSGRPISKHVSHVIDSGKRLFKTASLQNVEFLDAIPDEEKVLLWDLAILDAANRISKSVLGGS
jgi:hypothetical protein